MFGRRAFHVAGPAAWNSLPDYLRENWKRPQGCPCITWLNTVQCDLRAYNLTLNEAVDLAQNHPLCGLMSTYGAPSGACQKTVRCVRSGHTDGDVHCSPFAERSKTVQRSTLIVVLHQLDETCNIYQPFQQCVVTSFDNPVCKVP